MTQPKPSQHYRLSLNKAIQDYKDGIITATGLVYYTVGIYRKPGQKLRVKDIEAFCAELGIAVSTFYKAISKLKLKGRLHWEAISGISLWIPESNVVEIHSGQEFSTNVETDSIDVETDSPFGETDSPFGESDSTDGETDSTDGEKEPVEPLPDKGYSDSSTIYQSFSNTFHSSTAAFEGESVAEEEKKIIEKEERQQWIADMCRQLREIRINPQDVLWAVKKFPAPIVEDAIAYTKQQKWANKPAAVFVAACREGKKPEVVPLPEVPIPSIDELALLEAWKQERRIKDFYTQTWHGVELVVVDTGSCVLVWNEAIAQLGGQQR